MKTDKNFRMKKEYKMRLTNCKTREMRALMKRMWIEAQVTSDKSEYVVFK